jgi:hypothetical protein
MKENRILEELNKDLSECEEIETNMKYFIWDGFNLCFFIHLIILFLSIFDKTLNITVWMMSSHLIVYVVIFVITLLLNNSKIQLNEKILKINETQLKL